MGITETIARQLRDDPPEGLFFELFLSFCEDCIWDVRQGAIGVIAPSSDEDHCHGCGRYYDETQHGKSFPIRFRCEMNLSVKAPSLVIMTGTVEVDKDERRMNELRQV